MTELEQIEQRIETFKALAAVEVEEALDTAENAGQMALEAVHPGVKPVAVIEELPSPGFPWGSKWPFGLEHIENGVSVYPGLVRVGSTLYESEKTDIIFSAAGTWVVVWGWAYSDQSLTVYAVEKPGTTLNLEVLDSSGDSIGVIYEFVVTDSEGSGMLDVSLEKVWGAIHPYPQVWRV